MSAKIKAQTLLFSIQQKKKKKKKIAFQDPFSDFKIKNSPLPTLIGNVKYHYLDCIPMSTHISGSSPPHS